MSRLKIHKPFLQSILREANHHKRQVQLERANKDQINAVSELVLNSLKGNIPVSPHVVRKLAPYKDTLRELAKRKPSAKVRRALLSQQTGGNFWKGLECCYRQCRS